MKMRFASVLLCAAVVATVPGCLLASRTELNSAQSQNRALAEQSRAQFRANRGRPEAIAALAGLVRNEESFAPGEMVDVLREIVDGKLGGPADPLVEAQAAYLLSLEEDRRGDEEAEELQHRLAAVRHRAATTTRGADGHPGCEHRAGLAGHRAPPFTRIWS